MYEIPLLAESADRISDFDLILTIETEAEVRISRMAERGFDRQHVQDRMESQTSDANRRAIAHHVIENNGDRDALLRSLEQWWVNFITPRITD